MNIVPKNKTVYAGGKKFIEGDVVPPYIKFKIIENRTIKKKKEEERPKRVYRSRRGSTTKVSDIM
ncbi:hypothetical protein AMJ80_04450 [bacterium SM23_31]|nr:MAG: hypothetical protein AMJ80_04450 [bacterium SM23_31]